ncbi:HAD family hydrolase [Brachybacterium huguangmaarense]
MPPEHPADQHTTAKPWTDLPEPPPEVRLVVADMDGTLLDADQRVPDAFWGLLDTMVERGIVFVPASGRQHQTLVDMFDGRDGITSFIAENGTVVVLDGEVVDTTEIDPSVVADVICAVREAAEERDLGLVVCRADGAVIERTDARFREQCDIYYHRLDEVGDLLEHTEGVVKLAIYDFGDAEETADEVLGRFAETQQVAVSGKHWIDLMDASAHKGHGVRALQEALGASRAQTVVFGDYLNDLQMFDEADLGFAMDNAHARIKDAAAYIAPSNADAGVVQVLRRLLGEG